MANLSQCRSVIQDAMGAMGQEHRQPTLPEQGRFVLVQCRFFRCLGFYDARGKWRNAQTVQELTDVQAWCGIDDDQYNPVS